MAVVNCRKCGATMNSSDKKCFECGAINTRGPIMFGNNEVDKEEEKKEINVKRNTNIFDNIEPKVASIDEIEEKIKSKIFDYEEKTKDKESEIKEEKIEESVEDNSNISEIFSTKLTFEDDKTNKNIFDDSINIQENGKNEEHDEEINMHKIRQRRININYNNDTVMEPEEVSKNTEFDKQESENIENKEQVTTSSNILKKEVKATKTDKLILVGEIVIILLLVTLLISILL